MRTHPSGFVGLALFVGLVAGLGLSLPLARGQARNPTISVNEIKEGMKGYGLTVFRGTVPERFDVEVVGVLHNFRPSQDLILIKTPHPRLNITRNVKGMSGSPIYLDGGRLAGAYAYSLSNFQAEPVAGVTPIAPMLTEMQRPIPPGFWPSDGRAPLPAPVRPVSPRRASLDSNGFEGAPGGYNLLAHAEQMAKRVARDRSGPVPTGTPLLMAGVGDRAAQLARKLFEPLGLEPMAAGGGQSPQADAPQHYVDGGAIGVQLTTGDVSLMGLGTVTHVQGNKLVAFGHPMFNAGDSALPTAIGRVLWIYASEQHSFKVGEAVRPLGALVQDRQSAIVIDEKQSGPTFPVRVEVKGVEVAPRKVWNSDVVEEKFMSPGLMATVFGSVVEATISERRDVTWQLHSKVSIKNHGTVELDDFGVAVGGLPEAGEWAASRAVRAVGDVLNNPWEPARIERVESTLNVQYTRDLWRLRGVELLDDEVDAGQRARITLHLSPFAGPDAVRTIEVTMAPELAGRDVELEILPGYEVTPELSAPENLTQLIANEPRQSVMPKSIVVQYRVPSQGVTYRGHVAARLPDFALDALRPTHASVGPDPFNSYVRTVIPMDRYIDGHDRVKVKVRENLR
ncbi:hypothetical protein LZC95_03870 [Pendulispora brunnea]|uniref:Peptidase S55 domain-containing protein n=1 Tax=Pendulispora brunnea TaxID=2905690 RepID=A0ABZ2KFW3_9BACT